MKTPLFSAKHVNKQFKISNKMTASSLIYSIVALNLSALIAGVKSQFIVNNSTSNATSADCLVVIRIWNLVRNNTTPSLPGSNSCCSIAGVTCSSGSTVIKIDWKHKGLAGPIPSEIGNLQKLNTL